MSGEVDDLRQAAQLFIDQRAEFMALPEEQRRAPGVPAFWHAARAFQDACTPELVIALIDARQEAPPPALSGADHIGDANETIRAPALSGGGDLAERVARAIDPVAWKWLDTAPADHPAREPTLNTQLRQARAAIASLNPKNQEPRELTLEDVLFGGFDPNKEAGDE